MSIDLHTLSGAYAVNALSAVEGELFATHLEQCAACRDEVREFQEAVATMGASEAVIPPSALKARILAAADQQPQLPPNVTSIEHARSRRLTSRIIGAAAAVILVVTAGFGLSQMQHSDESSVMAGSVEQVFNARDAHTETVDTSNGGKVTVATSDQLGRMAVETNALPSLSRKQVYQMWAIHNGVPTSAGVVDDIAAGKAMSIPADDTTVAITIEPAGGSDQPSTKPILELDPTTV